MAAAFLRRALRPFQRPWKPLDFPGSRTTWSAKLPLEEEAMPGPISRYYPVRMGEIFRNQYQVVGKLGVGVNSTAWLARDLE